MTGDHRGVLYPTRLPEFHRLPPPDGPAARLVRWFWFSDWDVAPGRVSRQHLIAFPSCNLVVERGPGSVGGTAGLVGLSGPTTRASHRDLAGRGWAVGALLRPAAVPAVTDEPAAVRDTYLPLELPELLDLVTGARGVGERGRAEAAAAFAAWLTRQVPEPSAEALLANRMADLIDGDPSVLRVEDAADRLSVSVRTLQRLATRYVGLPPATMIRRRRLQEAATLVRTEPDADLASIAADLGYTDHAHLTNDFRSVLGFTPSAYRRASSAGEG